jgi:predicted dinucleotide-utilizing enzyme
MRFANAPSPDNPKTSMLTALSILAALEPLLSSKPRLS